MTPNIRLWHILIPLVLLFSQIGCSELNDAPPDVTVDNLTYTTDMKAIFDNNCISCHSGASPLANYDMTTYAGVISGATAGDSSSTLVQKSIEGGSMNSFYSSDSEIDKVVQWVVVDGLSE